MGEQRQRGHLDLDQNQFCCSVCLELLRDPVTIQCGHSYCRSCIEGCWDEEEKRGQYSCPQCRETFSPRPTLRRSNMLAEVVEKLKTNPQQPAHSAAPACAGPGDVVCDFCPGAEPNKATMSCLTCLASFCAGHLQPHYSFAVLKTHQLISATIPLQEKICTQHNKLMEIYCQTDKKCICYLCTIDKHRGHRTASAAAERAVEQKQLIVNQKYAQERFKEREVELSELALVLKDFKDCTQTAVESCEEIFDKLISSIKEKRAEVKHLIKAQEENAVAKAADLQQELEQDAAMLKKRDADLENISHTDDNIHFIQTFQSLSGSCESPHLPLGAVARPRHSFEVVTDCVSKLSKDMKSLLMDTWPQISATVSSVDCILPPVPGTRDEFLKYCCPLTLDVNTAYKYLDISQEKRKATYGSFERYYSSHSDRFHHHGQVLCREGLSGRCYWEVHFTGSTWSLAVSYKDINRTSSHDSEFGKTNKSWSFEYASNYYTFRHDAKSEVVQGPQSSTIGVYLNYKAGTLSFYSISEAMTLLYTAHSTFTQPLHPGFRLKSSQSVLELVKLW